MLVAIMANFYREYTFNAILHRLQHTDNIQRSPQTRHTQPGVSRQRGEPIQKPGSDWRQAGGNVVVDPQQIVDVRNE